MHAYFITLPSRNRSGTFCEVVAVNGVSPWCPPLLMALRLGMMPVRVSWALT